MVSMLASGAVDHGFIGGVMVSMLATGAVDHGFIGGVMVSMLASGTVDHGFIGDVMVSMLASGTVDHGFIGGVMVSMGSSPDQVQPKTIKFVFVCFFANHAAIKRKSKDSFVGIRIMCLSGARCLSTD
jgi:hypothetical protein